MNEVFALILMNMEKVGFGAIIFLMTYLANMALGAWKNVKIDGSSFDWKMIGNSVVKYVVLVLGIALLSVAVVVVPEYVTYVGIEIEAAVLETIDAIVIVGAFLTSAIRYIADGISKLKAILGAGK